MVTAHAPFTGESERRYLHSARPPPLTRYMAHAPAKLSRLSANYKDRAQRYRSAHELEALKDQAASWTSNHSLRRFRGSETTKAHASQRVHHAAYAIIQPASGFPAWDQPNQAPRLVMLLLTDSHSHSFWDGPFDYVARDLRHTGAHGQLRIPLRRNRVIIPLLLFLLLPCGRNAIDKSIAVLRLKISVRMKKRILRRCV